MSNNIFSYDGDRPVHFQQFSEDELKGFLTHYYGSEELGIMRYHEQMALAKNATQLGLKPEPGEADVHITPVTTQLSVRIWGKGLEKLKLYCFDFIDQNEQPVNTPKGWKIVTIPGPADYLPPMAIHSVEVNFGLRAEDILPGNEKYVVPEGLRCSLSIPNKPIIMITIPTRAH